MKTAKNFRTKLTITLLAISMLVTGPVLGSILPDTLNAGVVVEAAGFTDTAKTTTPRLSIWQRFKARRQQRRLQRAAARRARYSEARRPRTTLRSIARLPLDGAKRIASGVKRLLQRAEQKRSFRAVTGTAAIGGSLALGLTSYYVSGIALAFVAAGVTSAAVVVPVVTILGLGLVGLYASYKLARWGMPRTWRALRGKKS